LVALGPPISRSLPTMALGPSPWKNSPPEHPHNIHGMVPPAPASLPLEAPRCSPQQGHEENYPGRGFSGGLSFFFSMIKRPGAIPGSHGSSGYRPRNWGFGVHRCQSTAARGPKITRQRCTWTIPPAPRGGGRPPPADPPKARPAAEIENCPTKDAKVARYPCPAAGKIFFKHAPR